MDKLERMRQQMDIQDKQIYWMDKAIRDYERLLSRHHRIPEPTSRKLKGLSLDPFVLLEQLLLKVLDALEWFVGKAVDYAAARLHRLYLRIWR